MTRPFPVFARLVVAAAACVATTFGVASAQELKTEKKEVVVKRRADLSDEDLRKQLQQVQELGLNQGTADNLYAPIKKAGAEVKNLPPDLGPRAFGQITTQLKRPDQFAMPWRAGADSEMGKEAAERLHVLSTKLRDSLRKSVKAGDVRPDPEKLVKLLDDPEWTTPEAIPTITQMMQAENTPIRLLMVDMLSQMKGKQASIALAQRAVFDLSPGVREKAIKALAERPSKEYAPVLAYGIRYPWAAAADHAAEAIVALELNETVPELVKLLKEPNPNLPVKQDNNNYTITEVVRVNHLCNCMLCHAPSLSNDDLVRGRVPMPGEDPPPLYYAERTGIFVRADLTYLRQDFSVVQPVANAGKWPGNQRYDYVLRTRPLTKQEITTYQKLEKDGKIPKEYPQQGSIVFALKELTKQDYGTTYEQWNEGVQKLLKSPGGQKYLPQGDQKPLPPPEEKQEKPEKQPDR